MPKKLVIFCDGTWNRADKKTKDGRPCHTNVFRLFQATLPYDRNDLPNPQILHYIEGVGTRRTERLRGGGFGLGISDNIKNAYCFIISNYQPGDEIFLFGFSRGAYTARSIAGLIRNMGILRRDKLHLISEAYRLYKDRSPEWHPESDQSKEFREKNTHQNETIKFLGVWDTVGALGAPFGAVLSWIVDKLFQSRFHDVQLSSIIESASHALAIDERRWPFRPTLWTLNENHLQRNAQSQVPLYEQKWFPGVHSNVGGGYPDTRLSDCTLKWMAEKARYHGLNLDLSMISDPPYQLDLTANIENSQTWFYRLATVLFVKLPNLISTQLVFPKENRPLVGDIQLNGDYVRPIDNLGDIKTAVAQYANPTGYSGDISECTIQKLATTPPSYRPCNIPL